MRTRLHPSTFVLRAGLVAALVLGAGALLRGDTDRADSPGADAAVRAAIVAAVQDRLGPSADVVVDRLWVPSWPAASSRITAVAEPGARLGRPVQFKLMTSSESGPGVRFGSAVASLTVRVEHTRLVSPVRPGATVASDHVAGAVDVVSEVRLERLPLERETVGTRARQLLSPGAVIEEWMLERPPLVRSGDLVGVRAIVGGVEARGVAKAGERGVLGAVIRLVNVSSGRALKGRVVAQGEVEVIP